MTMTAVRPTATTYTKYIFISLLSAIICFKAGCTLWLLKTFPHNESATSHSFIANDFPRTWPIPERRPVRMPIEDSRHYELNTPTGAAEWAALIPRNGTIYLGEGRHPFTISMFHQLRCLDIIRSDMSRADTTGVSAATELSRHCLNYLRQMVLCRSDVRLENLRGNRGTYPGLVTCKDWTAVYKEVKENQDQYFEWKMRNH